MPRQAHRYSSLYRHATPLLAGTALIANQCWQPIVEDKGGSRFHLEFKNNYARHWVIIHIPRQSVTLVSVFSFYWWQMRCCKPGLTTPGIKGLKWMNGL